MTRSVTVVMDLPTDHEYHRATIDAIDHAVAALRADVVVRLETTDDTTGIGDGFVIGPGSPYRDPNAAEEIIRFARERGVPLVAT